MIACTVVLHPYRATAGHPYRWELLRNTAMGVRVKAQARKVRRKGAAFLIVGTGHCFIYRRTLRSRGVRGCHWIAGADGTLMITMLMVTMLMGTLAAYDRNSL